jgi:hypothetical protein
LAPKDRSGSTWPEQVLSKERRAVFIQENVMEFSAMYSNLSKLIFCAAIAAASITTPAWVVHKSTPMSHQNAYGTRSSQGSGVYSCSFDCDWY